MPFTQCHYTQPSILPNANFNLPKNSLGKMALGKMELGKMALGKMELGKMELGKMALDKLSCNHFKSGILGDNKYQLNNQNHCSQSNLITYPNGWRHYLVVWDNVKLIDTSAHI